MRLSKMSTIAATALTALTLSLLSVVSAEAAPPTANGESETVASWDGSTLVVDESKLPVLRDSKKVSVGGTRSADGGCDFQSPKLSLAPGEVSVVAREILIDNNRCTATWQVGSPVNPNAFPATTAGPDTDSIAAMGTSQLSATPMATRTSSGFYKAWKTDVANLTLNYVQSNIAWNWTGSCVTSVSGSGNWYWRSASGWEPPNPKSSTFAGSGCGARFVNTTGHYRNKGFCFPVTVYAHYDKVEVQGQANGTLLGGATTSHSGNCLPFFDHRQLTRTAG